MQEESVWKTGELSSPPKPKAREGGSKAEEEFQEFGEKRDPSARGNQRASLEEEKVARSRC